MNKCLKCNRELLTADINGICSKCRGETFSETSTPLIDEHKQIVYANLEPYLELMKRTLKKVKRRGIIRRKMKRGMKK